MTLGVFSLAVGQGSMRMGKYHFHLWDGTTLIHDPEGADLVDMAAVRERALQTARELLAEEICDGKLPLYMRLDVEDEGNRIVHRLSFADVVQILH
jgi:hypothetical protein